MSESELESLQCFPFHVPETGERSAGLIKQRLEELTGVPWEVREKDNLFDVWYVCRQWRSLPVLTTLEDPDNWLFTFATPPFDRSRWILDEELLKLAAMVAARWAQGPREVL